MLCTIDQFEQGPNACKFLKCWTYSYNLQGILTKAIHIGSEYFLRDLIQYLSVIERNFDTVIEVDIWQLTLQIQKLS